MLDDINRLNRLITVISEASRLDAELMRGEVKQVDLNALLGDMVNHYAVTAVQKGGVEVEYRLAPPTPPFLAHGHDGRYGQVFRNVIDNALSFSPAGSKIVVELSRAPRGGPFTVTIDDQGPGIPQDNLESIFQRFYSERPTEHFGQHSGLEPVDLPADHGDLRRLDLGLQPPGCRRPRAGRALHRARAGGRRPQVIMVRTASLGALGAIRGERAGGSRSGRP